MDKIENKIRGSLKNCTVKDNWPQYESFSAHVDSLSDEILKHKKEWLDTSDVYSIFYDFVYTAIRTVISREKQMEGKLWEILGEEKSQELTKSLKDYFSSIPRTFYIYLPIPNITRNLPNPIKLSEDMSLVSFQNAEEVPGGYGHGLLAK
ncbi:hypothetical protein NP603_20315 [Methylomonas sp. SURF-1]|uniref:Uncharacterized protein n=1 Tax=Methylomonas aurea TaxID=2952224 RepID=A0ABT1UNQ5_9GAMM|nr:hypothetical protein [Methylomonas sp. SURF-1]MCQ8183468.1 hypothetical protein [Methylomonas sp. SURF-1]